MKFSWPRLGAPALSSIQTWLLLSYLVLGLGPLGVLGWVVWTSLDQFYIEHVSADMSAEAQALADAMVDDLRANQIQAAQQLLNGPAVTQNQFRVLLYDRLGHLVAASANSASGKESEPGLAQALTGHTTQGVDQSPSLAAPVVYVAVPVQDDAGLLGALQLSYILSDAQAELNTLRLEILAVSLGLGAGAILISLSLARTITAPLNQFRQAAFDIAGGHFDRRVSGAMPAELAPVAHSFNFMADTLQREEQSRRVTFANLAHDVRTPLGSIRAAAEALSGGAAEQPELRDRLTAGLIVQTNHLQRLTDDLLRLAVYEGGGLTLNRTTINVAAVLQMAVEATTAAASQRGIAIQTAPIPDLPQLSADTDRLLEVLLNLIDNALRYTPPNGRITLRVQAEASPAAVIFHVEDTGPGLPPELLPHLFQRYRRGDTRRQGAGLNVGLGLSIAQALVAAHDGQIAARNLPEGGADFFFTLPAERD